MAVLGHAVLQSRQIDRKTEINTDTLSLFD